MSFQAGATVGGYKIVELIGSGASGQVFKVEHSVTCRVEAMKILVDGRSSEAAQRFLREITLHASLNHPAIASVYNAFWVEDDLVMVMELVDGDSLQRVLERRRLTIDEAIDYASQVLSALSYAHSRGVVHRDIKPANIIVTRDGTLKVTDFGIAKAVTDPQINQGGAVVGSLYYMAPEQVKGSEQVDARSDIYSVGAVLYEMCTGRKPFDAENSFQLMLAQVEQEPRPPVECWPALQDVIMTALAKKPTERFRDVDVFREALEAAKYAPRTVRCGQEEVEADPAPVVRQDSARHTHRLVMAGALIVVLLAALTLWRTGITTPKSPAAAKAASQVSDTDSEQGGRTVEAAARPAASSAPDGSAIASRPVEEDPLKELASLPPPPIPRDTPRRSATGSPQRAAAKPNPFSKTTFVPPPARKAQAAPAVLPDPPKVLRSDPNVPMGVPGERSGPVIRTYPSGPPPVDRARPAGESKNVRSKLRKAIGRILRPFNPNDDEPANARQRP